MQRLINLRSAINDLSMQLIVMNKTVNDMIEVHATPSESPSVDKRLLEVLGDKLTMQLDCVGSALEVFTEVIGGLLPDDEEDSDI